MQYVSVVIDNKSQNTDIFYTYRAPDSVAVGDKVLVPFARRKKPVDGYVFETGIEPEISPSRIKDISDVDSKRSLNAEMVETAVWMKGRYGTKYIDGIKLFTVGGKKDTRKMVKIQDGPDEEQVMTLSSDQQKAVDRIDDQLESGEAGAFLIKGVTNSGKTEVYMRAAEKALALGRTVIVLASEIALSSQIRRRFERRFGKEIVATLHSRLTTSQKLAEWLRIREGTARIIVGARTAVFAPAENIGLIVIDEEHETTYKSDHNPKYETVDVAYKRCLMNGGVLLMGSATPSIVSYSRAKDGIYQLITMNSRIGSSVMPDVEIADMRQEVRDGNRNLLSRRLYDAIRETLDRNEQIILFLNRRGFAPSIFCRDCGARLKCPDCGISLTYHKSLRGAMCHYCGRVFPVPDKCAECGSTELRMMGAGTERIQEQVEELFPDASTARFDLDTATSQKEIDKTISDFEKGKTNILIGTQILAKGLDFGNVGLVGIVLADTTLNIPDYRASERTFQLITQVSGRAGRRSGRSRVIIQTFEPEDDAIAAAARGDYEEFYETELLHRRIMNYPPFSDIIALSFTGADDRVTEDQLMEKAEAFRQMLMNIPGMPPGAQFLKVKPDTLRTGGKERVTFIVKAPKGTRSGYVRLFMEERERGMERKDPWHIEIDINPY